MVAVKVIWVQLCNKRTYYHGNVERIIIYYLNIGYVDSSGVPGIKRRTRVEIKGKKVSGNMHIHTNMKCNHQIR